jgi:hypothetical protein
LHTARKSIDGIYGDTQRSAGAALLYRNGVRRKRQRKIGSWRRRWSGGPAAATSPRQRE